MSIVRKTNTKRKGMIIMTTTELIELQTIYDSRKSFYKKAFVHESDNVKTLYSYETKVARIKNDKATVFGTYSMTTLRHIKEFLLQNGFKAENKKQIENDYLTERNDL